MSLEELSFTKNFEEHKEKYFLLLRIIQNVFKDACESNNIDPLSIPYNKENFDRFLQKSLAEAIFGLKEFTDKLNENIFWLQHLREAVANHQADYIIKRAYDEGLL